MYSGRESIPIKARRVVLCRDARSVRPLYQRLQHRSFNGNGRSTERPYKGLLVRCVAIVSSCFRNTYEFQKQFPSWNFLVPRQELFGSSGGTLRFQGWNSSVPTEELFSSNGGTLRSLGRKSKTLRTYDLILPKFHLILPKFHLILPKFHCLAYLRRGCAWRLRLPEKVPPPTAGYSYSLYPPIVAIFPSYDTSHTRCLTSIEVLWMQYGLLFNALSRDKNTY